jgi:hypothetical protein
MAKPGWMSQRLYQWTTPRSLGLHFLFVLIAGGCLTAMWWQVQRAAQGNVLSYLYSVEWPAIAVVVGIGWWQLVHDTPEDIARRSEYHRRMRAASAEVVARTLPRSARALTVGSEEIGGRSLGAAPSPRAVTTGAPERTGTELVAPRRDLVPAGADARLLSPDEAAEGASDEMTEYNRYLATLAVQGRPKTWRNPRGL